MPRPRNRCEGRSAQWARNMLPHQWTRDLEQTADERGRGGRMALHGLERGRARNDVAFLLGARCLEGLRRAP